MTGHIMTSQGAARITFVGLLSGPIEQVLAAIGRTITQYAEQSCRTCLHSSCKAYRDPCQTCLCDARHGSHPYWAPQVPRIREAGS